MRKRRRAEWLPRGIEESPGSAGWSERVGEQGPCRPPMSLIKQPREEVLDAVAEVDGALSRVLPGALGLGLRRLARFLELLAGVFRALDDGVADALRRLLDTLTDLALADLFGAVLHLPGRRLHLRIVGRAHGQDTEGQEYRDRDESRQPLHHHPPALD